MQRQTQRAKWALATLLVFLALGAATVQAQEYPNKPINLIIPLGAGGGHDLTARAITPIAQKYLGQPLILQHKPGGGGSIASMQVAKAEPDGYTLLFGGVGPNCALPAIEKGRSAGPDDLAAVCMVAGYSGLVVGRAGAPFKTIKQLVAYAKANPGKVVVATSGPWGSTDIGQKKLMLAAGYTARIVPYDGGGPAILAVVG
jgi:tripartite-type tricarboxylate transporter receptor subunit TctC